MPKVKGLAAKQMTEAWLPDTEEGAQTPQPPQQANTIETQKRDDDDDDDKHGAELKEVEEGEGMPMATEGVGKQEDDDTEEQGTPHRGVAHTGGGAVDAIQQNAVVEEDTRAPTPRQAANITEKQQEEDDEKHGAEQKEEGEEDGDTTDVAKQELPHREEANADQGASDATDQNPGAEKQRGERPEERDEAPAPRRKRGADDVPQAKKTKTARVTTSNYWVDLAHESGISVQTAKKVHDGIRKMASRQLLDGVIGCSFEIQGIVKFTVKQVKHRKAYATVIKGNKLNVSERKPHKKIFVKSLLGVHGLAE